MKNISKQRKSMIGFGLVWVLLLSMCFGAKAQTAWTNCGNGYQTRVVGSVREYRVIMTTGYAPLLLTDSLAKKVNLADSVAKYVTPTQLNAAIAGATIPDATTSVKGKLKLSGDLAGTADAPTVPGLAIKENVANKSNTLTAPNNITYPTTKAVDDAIEAIEFPVTSVNGKQNTVVLNSNDISSEAIGLGGDVTTALTTLNNAKVPNSEKGSANGVATLDAGGKVPTSQLPAGSQVFKGAWNASANTPTLADGVGTAGWTYRVTVGGTRDLGSGSINWIVGSDVVYNGTKWEQFGSGVTVNSVNGMVGDVVLGVDNISGSAKTDGSNATGTWPIISNTANYWGGQTANFSNKISNITSIGVFGSGTGMGYSEPSDVRSWLNETLPGVVSRNSVLPLSSSINFVNTDLGIGTPSSDGLQIYAGANDRVRIGKMLSGIFTEALNVFVESGNTNIGFLADQGRKLAVNGTGLFNGKLSIKGASNGLTFDNPISLSEGIIHKTNGLDIWNINKGGGDGTENYNVYNFGRSKVDLSVNNSTGNVVFGNEVTAIQFNGHLNGSANNATSSNNSILWNGQVWGGTYVGGEINGFIVENTNTGAKQHASIPNAQAALGLGTNAYTSTPYLPLAGGILTGSIDGTEGYFRSIGVSVGTNGVPVVALSRVTSGAITSGILNLSNVNISTGASAGRVTLTISPDHNTSKLIQLPSNKGGEIALTSDFESGTYTPVFTSGSNVSFLSLGLCHFIRVGKQVTVYGSFSSLTTTLGAQQFQISLPITPSIINNTDLQGHGIAENNSGQLNIALFISGDSVSKRAAFNMESGTATGGSGKFSFMYTAN